MTKPIPGIWLAVDIMNGQKPFPTFNKKGEDKGFKEVLDKEIERLKGAKNEQS